jgi:acetyl esterase
MPLDPKVKSYLDQLAAAGIPPLHQLTPQLVRQALRAQNEAQANQKREPVARVVDRTLPGTARDIPVRLYTPDGAGPFPIVVYFHGGGWCFGDLEIGDATCRSLTNLVECLVVSVDYRLAPEYPFPAGLEDCYSAVKWLAENSSEVNGDARRIAVAGESAGGNLATAVALVAKERGGPPLVFQVLIYPNTDTRLSMPSIEENASGYGIGKEDVRWAVNHYFSNQADFDHRWAAVIQATDPAGLPAALILTAEFDPLRDEGEEYGKHLEAAGVPTTISRYDGVIHGFVSNAQIFEQGKQALEEIAASLREVFKLQK